MLFRQDVTLLEFFKNTHTHFFV